jgi:hypothetical protein
MKTGEACYKPLHNKHPYIRIQNFEFPEYHILHFECKLHLGSDFYNQKDEVIKQKLHKKMKCHVSARKIIFQSLSD